MNLSEIRQHCPAPANTKTNVKAATRLWLQSLANDYPLALTLTLKQTFAVDTQRGTHYRRLTPADCERITQRFQQKLNRAVFGQRCAEKFGRSLKYLPVLEGQRSGKNLHLHLAIGGLPEHIMLNQFEALVREAMHHVPEINVQMKVDVADSGWFEYITKETGSTHSDNVLWALVN